jgi:integrase
MNEISYDVRLRKTRVYAGANVKTYTVRWTVEGQEFTEPFRNNVAQADSFRSELVAAARKGEAFSAITGRPVSWKRTASEMNWYEFACAYTDMKWKSASAKYRNNIARALRAATPAMLIDTRGKPDDALIRKALTQYAFNTKMRSQAPEDITAALTWVRRNTANVSTLANPANARALLDAATTNVDGKRAAASTARRHRTIIANALDYAKELGAIDTGTNPIRALKWKAPVTLTTVDRRSVVNPAQARTLLAGVRAQQPSGPRLVAFFGTIYFAALRPEEVISLGKNNLTLPPHTWNAETKEWEDPPGSDGWGEFEFGDASPDAGRDWTDDGDQRDRRQLKHRAHGDTRTVPIHPELAKLLREHIEQFGYSPDGKLFTGIKGGELPTITIRRAWIATRASVLTEKEHASPLAKRIYDLRHACLSLWLNAGVPPTQVAAWAGHSVDVLLRIYAKCIDGQDAIAKRRISEALREETDHASAPAGRDASPGPAEDDGEPPA